MTVAAKFDGCMILYKDKDLYIVADTHNAVTVTEENVPLSEETIIEAFVFFLRDTNMLFLKNDKEEEAFLVPRDFFFECIKKTRWNEQTTPIFSTYERLINTDKKTNPDLFKGLRLALGYHVLRYKAETQK